MLQPVIVIGAGGHAKVLISALLLNHFEILGVVDVEPAKRGCSVLGVPVLGDDELVSRYHPAAILLVNGVGSVAVSHRRRLVFEKFKASGYHFASVVHPAAIIASDVVLLEGVQVMAGAVIQPGSTIGRNSIVNTRASVDHDCLIGDHVHLSPGVTLSGEVVVADEAHIGTGATIIQGVSVGNCGMVAAGAVVVNDVADRVIVMGVPAKVVQR